MFFASFKGAVYEHVPVIHKEPLVSFHTRQFAVDVMRTNLEVFTKQAALASQQVNTETC